MPPKKISKRKQDSDTLDLPSIIKSIQSPAKQTQAFSETKSHRSSALVNDQNQITIDIEDPINPVKRAFDTQ